jgi:hypothetical protein
MSGVDFGWQPMGGPGEQRTVTVANSGAGPLVIERVGLEGPHSGDFTIVRESFSHVEIWPGCQCTVDVRFEPGAPGSREAVLLLFGRAPAGVYRVPLTGRATVVESDAAVCEATLVKHDLKVTVPVELNASGKAGDIDVTCGRRWEVSKPFDQGCETVLFQEITFSVPVTLRVEGECNGRELLAVACSFLSTQTVCVELPVRVGAAVECSQEGWTALDGVMLPGA